MSDLETELTAARNTLTADRMDMSFGELMNMYVDNELVIDPEFQRYFRWDTYQRTRFIESVLCGIPVPSVFMAEDQHGKWEVVDGLQRISTILSFFGVLTGEMAKENGWKMCQGDIVNGLENKGLEDLPLKFQLNIKRSSIRIEVIKWDSEYDMRYELFNRLNTGGSPLTDQEVRNCIFRATGSDLSKEIRELAQNEDLLDLVKPTERQLSQLYMDELVLRYYALMWQEDPKKNLGEHLTEYMRKASEDHSIYEGNKETFLRTIALVKNCGVSRPYQGSNNQFSPSKYDGIMIGVSENLGFYENNPGELADKIADLSTDASFLSATGVASNYKERVKKRIARAKEIFERE